MSLEPIPWAPNRPMGQRAQGVHPRPMLFIDFGKSDFSNNQLLENLHALYKSVEQNRPSGVKGKYFKSLFICTSMGPSIQLDLNAFD